MSFKILSLPPIFWNEDATIKDLFFTKSKQWNVQLLLGLFSQEEVDLIYGIPLSLRDCEDRKV